MELHALLQRAALFQLRRHMSGHESITADQALSLAEDVAQDASLVVLRKLDTFRGEAKFTTWAAAIAVACALGVLRRKRWRDVSLDRLPDHWPDPAAAIISQDGWANPQMANQRHAIWEVIREVIGQDLTAHQREALNLLVLQGLSTEEVEGRLGMTPSALYKLTHDARRKLKAGLQRRGFTVEEILHAFAAEG